MDQNKTQNSPQSKESACFSQTSEGTQKGNKIDKKATKTQKTKIKIFAQEFPEFWAEGLHKGVQEYASAEESQEEAAALTRRLLQAVLRLGGRVQQQEAVRQHYGITGYGQSSGTWR